MDDLVTRQVTARKNSLGTGTTPACHSLDRARLDTNTLARWGTKGSEVAVMRIVLFIPPLTRYSYVRVLRLGVIEHPPREAG